jgi:hypothetical protein
MAAGPRACWFTISPPNPPCDTARITLRSAERPTTVSPRTLLLSCYASATPTAYRMWSSRRVAQSTARYRVPGPKSPRWTRRVPTGFPKSAVKTFCKSTPSFMALASALLASSRCTVQAVVQTWLLQFSWIEWRMDSPSPSSATAQRNAVLHTYTHTTRVIFSLKTLTHSHLRSRTQTHIHARHTRKHTRTHTHTHTHTQTHTHTHTHTHRHTHTHTHTCTHAHRLDVRRRRSPHPATCRSTARRRRASNLQHWRWKTAHPQHDDRAAGAAHEQKRCPPA